LEKQSAEADLRRRADAEAHRQLQIQNQAFIEKYRSERNHRYRTGDYPHPLSQDDEPANYPKALELDEESIIAEKIRQMMSPENLRREEALIEKFRQDQELRQTNRHQHPKSLDDEPDDEPANYPRG
jgi:hypothetical protein